MYWCTGRFANLIHFGASRTFVNMSFDIEWDTKPLKSLLDPAFGEEDDQMTVKIFNHIESKKQIWNHTLRIHQRLKVHDEEYSKDVPLSENDLAWVTTVL